MLPAACPSAVLIRGPGDVRLLRGGRLRLARPRRPARADACRRRASRSPRRRSPGRPARGSRPTGTRAGRCTASSVAALLIVAAGIATFTLVVSPADPGVARRADVRARGTGHGPVLFAARADRAPRGDARRAGLGVVGAVADRCARHRARDRRERRDRGGGHSRRRPAGPRPRRWRSASASSWCSSVPPWPGDCNPHRTVAAPVPCGRLRSRAAAQTAPRPDHGRPSIDVR